MGGRAEGGVFEEADRPVGHRGGRGIEPEITVAVTLHPDVGFGRRIALHESRALAKQRFLALPLPVEIDAVFLPADLQEVAVGMFMEAG